MFISSYKSPPVCYVGRGGMSRDHACTCQQRENLPGNMTTHWYNIHGVVSRTFFVPNTSFPIVGHMKSGGGQTELVP